MLKIVTLLITEILADSDNAVGVRQLLVISHRTRQATVRDSLLVGG